MLKTSEAQTQKLIIEYLTLRGHLALRINTQGVPLWNGKQMTGFRPSPMRGVADILVCMKNGKFAGIEVKSSKGKPTEEQTAFLANVIGRGGIGIVARSIEDVQQAGL